MSKQEFKTIIKHLNYKDLLIILGLWYLMAVVAFLTGELSLKFNVLTDFLHYLFILSGRFIFLALILFYLTSLYQVSFRDIGFIFKNFIKQVFIIFSLLSILLLSVLFFINIPLSYKTLSKSFLPLYMINKPEDFINSLFPFVLLFISNIIFGITEILLLAKILLELFNTAFNKYIATIFTGLFYSILLLQFKPSQILINFIIAFISLYIYLKNRSLISSSLLIAGYYTIYILYIYGWNFIRF